VKFREAVLTSMPSGLVLRIINARVTHGHVFNSRDSRDIHVIFIEHPRHFEAVRIVTGFLNCKYLEAVK
jgi:hypothetical protein